MRHALMAIAALAAAAGPAAAQTTLGGYPMMTTSSFAAAEQAQELRDQAQCSEIGADRGHTVSSIITSSYAGLGVAVAEGILIGAAMGLTQDVRTAGATKSCMMNRGYTPLKLTDAQTAEYKALKTRDERSEWLANTPQYAVKRGSDIASVQTWDPVLNRPVTMRRDPATGELRPEYTVHP